MSNQVAGINQQIAPIDIPLELFSSLFLDMRPPTMPHGISPDNADVDFLPAAVFTRPALDGYYTTALDSPILYTTTFAQSGDRIYNIFVTAAGSLYKEDVINSPNTYTLLAEGLVSPGDYVYAITANPAGSGPSKLWMGAFDGEQGGSDIPTFYDGQNLVRVTQDGPAANLTVQEISANIAIIQITQPAFIGTTANASPLLINPDDAQITFYQNTTGIYSGQGKQTSPNPHIGSTTFGSSLVFNQRAGNFPITGFYGPEPNGGAYQNHPAQQIFQDGRGNYNGFFAFSEAAIGGSTGYGFDTNIQGTFQVASGGNITLYVQADDSWVLYLGGGATYVYGPQIGTPPPSLAGLTYIASRLTLAGDLQPYDKIVINFPNAGDYPYEFGWSNATSGGPQTYFEVTYATGNAANPGTNLGNWGNDIYPNFTSSNEVYVSQSGGIVTAITPVPHPFGVGDYVDVQGFAGGSGNSAATYNGIQQVTSVPSNESLTWAASATLLEANPGPATGGTLSPLVATANTTVQHGLFVGDQITIQNDSQNMYNTGNSIGSGANITVNPATWTVSGVIDPFTFQFNTLINVGNVGYGGYIGGAGQLQPGQREVAVVFQLIDGSLTAPSPTTTFTCTGGKKLQVSNIPIGPPDTSARYLLFTGANGGVFYFIPTTPYGTQTLFGGITSRVPYGTSTVVNDNTSTSAIFDFSDTTLYGADGAQNSGDNLFNQITLPPCVGVVEYANRLFWWGVWDSIPNFLNMGFNGGYNTVYYPLGWTASDMNNSTLAFDKLQGFSYAITGNASVTQQGLISQSAYQDTYNAAILAPSTLYRYGVKITPVILNYTSLALNPVYTFYQNFTQSLQVSSFTSFDPNGNISINGTTGLTFRGGTGNVANSYYDLAAPIAIPNANIDLDTGAITIVGAAFSAQSSGNVLAIYNDGGAINQANLICGINVVPSLANTNNINLFFQTSSTSTFIGTMNVADQVYGPSGQGTFNVILESNQVANSNITTLTYTVDAFVDNTEDPFTASINLPLSAVNGKLYTLVIANNANLTGSIFSLNMTFWPTYTANLAALPAWNFANAIPSGNLSVQLLSPSQGVLAQGNISLANVPEYGQFEFVTLNQPTPATIPADTLLNIFGTGIPTGLTIVLNDQLLTNDRYPVLQDGVIGSYAFNPTAYDGETGFLDIGLSNGEAVRACFVMNNLLYLFTDRATYYTQDDKTSEPSGWNVEQIATSVGILGPYGWALAEQGAFIADRQGLSYIQGLNRVTRVGDDMLPLWKTINWGNQHKIWVANDIQNRKTYCGVPLNGNANVSSVILLNRRGLDPGVDITEPIHISYSGRMQASDKTHKHSVWNRALNYATLQNVGNVTTGNYNTLDMVFAGNYGNVYTLNSNMYTDDDYGSINSYYTTYFFLNHAEEQQYQIGAFEKDYLFLETYTTGVGNLKITPYVENLNQPWTGTPTIPQVPLNLDNSILNAQDQDIEINLNITAERVAFRIEAVPNGNMNSNTANPNTDAAFNVEKFIVVLQPNNLARVRGR